MHQELPYPDGAGFPAHFVARVHGEVRGGHQIMWRVAHSLEAVDNNLVVATGESGGCGQRGQVVALEVAFLKLFRGDTKANTKRGVVGGTLAETDWLAARGLDGSSWEHNVLTSRACRQTIKAKNQKHKRNRQTHATAEAHNFVFRWLVTREAVCVPNPQNN